MEAPQSGLKQNLATWVAVLAKTLKIAAEDLRPVISLHAHKQWELDTLPTAINSEKMGGAKTGAPLFFVSRHFFERRGGGGGRGGGLTPPCAHLGGGVWRPPPPLRFKHGENIHTCQIWQKKKKATRRPPKRIFTSSNHCMGYDFDYRKTVVSNRQLPSYCRGGDACSNVVKNCAGICEIMRQNTFWSKILPIITFEFYLLLLLLI